MNQRKQIQEIAEAIQGLKKKYAGKPSGVLNALASIAEAMDTMDKRIEVCEREIGPGNEFIDIDGPHRIR